MYLGDPKLRGPGEKHSVTKKRIAEYIRCKEDVIYFAENYFYIVDIDKGKHKIKLREYQKRMLKAFDKPTNGRRHVIVNSARQIGKTTVSNVFLTHYVLFNEDKTVALLANKEKTAHEILRRIKLAIKEMPLWMQQGISDANGGWNKGAIGFENGVRVVASSTASTAIRGESISLMLLDEMAHIPNNIADEFMASVYPTIASSQTSKIIIASTPKGLNHFYHIWRGATETDPKKANSFMPVMIKWDEVPGRNNKFRENTIRDIGPQRWNQEFCGKFIGSSSTLIDSHILERMQIQNPIELRLGDCLNVYERPEKKGFYILGVDSASGTGKDYSTVQVLKITREHEIKQVATYANNLIDPYDFAQVVISISDYYNYCYMMIENNEIGKTVADTIFYDFEVDKILNCDAKNIGVRSTRTSKLAGNMLLKRYIDSGWLEIVDRQTIYELSRYEEIRLNIFKCQNGNDDCVMALLWALYFLNTVFFDRKNTGVLKIDDKFKISIEDKNEDQPIMFYQDDSPSEPELKEGWGYDEKGQDYNEYFGY